MNTQNKITQYEHYENYLKLNQKLGINISNNENLTIEELFSGTYIRRYEIDDKFKNIDVLLVPTPHHEMVQQQARSAHAPLNPVYNTEEILKRSIVDEIKNSSNPSEILITKLNQGSNAYIYIKDKEVKCKLYDIFDFICNCGDRYTLHIDNSGSVIRIVLEHKYLVTKSLDKNTIYGDFSQNDRLDLNQKEALVEGLEIIDNPK